MGKYIKSHSNFILQKKHQKIDDGTIFYQDQLTVNGISEFSNVQGQYPIYRDGNFLLTTRITNGYTRSMAPRKYLNNSFSGNIWTNEVLENYPVDRDSQIDTVQIKFSYYSLKDFSYYGSCAELVRASLNDIVSTFPAELYVVSKNGKGVSVEYRPEGDNTSPITIGEDGFFCNISNPFNIDIITRRAFSETEDSRVSPFRYFSNEGYLNYTVLNKEGYHDVVGWEVQNRYNLDGSLFEGTDDEWTIAVLNGKAKQCFMNGDELARITIYAEDGITIPIRAYKQNGSLTVLNTTDAFIDYHIRPQEQIYEDWYRNLDRFELILMQRDSSPIYTCQFEVLKLDEKTEEVYGDLQKFSFPIADGGWNLDIQGNSFQHYATSLRDMARRYDDLFCDNLLQNMTHESIKNMDWSVRKFYNAEFEDADYESGQQNINKIIRLIGREFDEVKFYIDGLAKMNVLNYRDDDTNMPDYFLSDSLELEGWEVVPPYTKTLNEWIEFSGSVLYRDVNPSGYNEFLDSFGGIEFDIDEKHNTVTPKCQNVTIVNIDGTKYPVSPDKTITVNGKVYQETTVSGIPCFDIVTDIPYTVRYIVVNGERFDVDENTKTVTVNQGGKINTYPVADGQTEVEISQAEFVDVRVYSFLYDEVPVLGEIEEGQNKIVFSIDRTGMTHNNVPVTQGLEKEVITVPLNFTAESGELQTTGWSNDIKVGNLREYFFDPINSSERVWINYSDSYPIDDVASSVKLSDGNVYTYTRQLNPVDGDKVVMSHSGVDARARYIALPFRRSQFDYMEKYGTMEGYGKNLKYNGVDEDVIAQQGTTRFVSGSIEDKILTFSSIKDDTGKNEWKSILHLYDNTYTPYTTEGTPIEPTETVTETTYRMQTVADAVAPKEGFVIDKDWVDFKQDFINLKNAGVKEAMSESNVNTTFTNFGVTGDIIYSAISGTPITSTTMSKYDLIGEYQVSFIYAHPIHTFAEQSTAGLNLKEMYWTLSNEVEEACTKSEQASSFSVIHNCVTSITSVYNPWDYAGMKVPLISYAYNKTVEITHADIADLPEIIEVGLPEDWRDYTGGTMFYNVAECTDIGNGLNGSGFRRSVPTVNTAYHVLYNKAITYIVKEDVLKGISSKYSFSTSSVTDPYSNKVIPNVILGSNVGLNLYGNSNGKPDAWFAYSFVPSFVTINENKFKRVSSGYCSHVPEFGGYLSPVKQENNEGFFAYNKEFAFLTDKREMLFTTEAYGYNHYLANPSAIRNRDCFLTGWTNERLAVGYPSITMERLINLDLQYTLPPLAHKIAFVPKKIYTDNKHSSIGGLNLPSIYKTQGVKVGLKNVNHQFVNVFAEREVMNDITIPTVTSVNKRNTDVTEAGKIYSYFLSAGTYNFLDNNSDNQKNLTITNTVGHNHSVTNVDRLGWFYFANADSVVTLEELGYTPYMVNDESTHTYKVPSYIKPLNYDANQHSYVTEDGTLVNDLTSGIYYLTDDGAGLFQTFTYTAQTYKDFEFQYKETKQKQVSEKVVVDVNSEEKQKHISNYYFPVTECYKDGNTYKLHREFSDDSDYEFTPYDCSLDEYCGGYFYKKCCVKVPANGRPLLSDRQPYVEYKNHKVYLCSCECDENYYTVVVNNVEYSAYSSANTITIEDTVLNIQYENIFYPRISNYSSTKTFDASDVSYRFMKNLRLNSRALLQRKGTIEGLEAMLGLFGLKSKKWYDSLTVMQQNSWGLYDYSIKEYTCFTNKIEDWYDKKLNMGPIAYYNKLKTIYHSNYDTQYNKYDGLPVRYISYYKDNLGQITDQKYSDDMSVNVEVKKDLYPYFEKEKVYDGRTYFQMNGGWLPIYPFRYSKNDDIVLPYMNDNQIMNGLHTETLRNIRSFQTLEELLDVNGSSVMEDQIVEVQDLSTVFAIVNGRLYEIFTDSFIFEDNDGVKREQICSYIKTFVRNHELEVGSVKYTNDIWVSDPLAYCYDDEGTQHDFTRHYDLNNENNGKMIRIFLYKYDNIYRMEPVNVKKDELSSDDELYVSITLYDSLYPSSFDIFKHDDEKFSHYFKLFSADGYDTLGYNGWYQLAKEDPDAIRIDSIEDNFKGNNPHSNDLRKYDNGFEYFARFAQLFKFPIENTSFDRTQFGYNGLEQYEDEVGNIGAVGFDNLVSVSGDISKYSVSGELINTRDNYNMIEDKKAHFFGNFYTNNRDCINVFQSNSKAINKFGQCDEVEMNDANTQFYGYNPTFYQTSGNVYGLGNISTLGLSDEMTSEGSYIRSNMGVSADTADYHTDRIMNNKILDINFVTDYEYYTKTYLEKYKYIEDVILFYLQQMIPSTTIARINFGGSLRYMIKEGAIFEIGAGGKIYVKQPDCGSVTMDYGNDIRIDSVTDLCPHPQPTTYYGVYYYNEGVLVKQEQVAVGSNGTYPHIEPRKGYTFIGWDGSCKDIRRETVLNTIWRKETEMFTVTFVSDGVILSSQQVEAGHDAIAPADPSKVGYYFKGWDKPFTNVADDITVNAVWERKWYGFELNGEQPIEPTKYAVVFKDRDTILSSQRVIEGQDAVAPNVPARTGYKFVGWSEPFTNVHSDLLLNAIWEVATFTVKFMSDKRLLKSETVEYGKSATPPTLTDTETNYFKGWDKPYANITADTTINAVWERKWYGFEING